jgi:hypothetical protein
MSRQVIPDSVKHTLIWFCAGAGTILPGYTFFTTFPPPIFPGISILTSVLSAAMIYIILNIKPVASRGEATNTQLIRWASLLLFAAFCSLLVYILLLRYCTVLEPQSYSQRFQIGFWKFDWSLTKAGILLKHQSPLAPVEDWMLREGAFTQGGAEIIWRAWSVVVAGCALVLTYMAGFVFWTVGFATLARHQRRSESRRSATKRRF